MLYLQFKRREDILKKIFKNCYRMNEIKILKLCVFVSFVRYLWI